MQPIIIAATPLTYTEYRKLSLADFRVRYPFYYIGLPVISFIPLLIIITIVAYDGIAAVEWKDIRIIVLIFGVAVFIWVATWYSLRHTYSRSSALREGTTYYLDEQGITQENSTQESVLWSNIAKTAVQSGQWILLRQASPTSKEIYFLNASGVIPPANRTELLALLKHKRIKHI